jgi:hypothetical protein
VAPSAAGAKPGITKADTGQPAFSTSSAIFALACVAGEQERTLVVDVPDGGQSCRVVSIETGGSPTVLATSDKTNTCISTVRNLLVKEQPRQSCFSRDTASLIGEREPPPSVREVVNTMQGKVLPGFSNYTVGLLFLCILVIPFLLLGYGARDVQHRMEVKREARKNGRQPV